MSCEWVERMGSHVILVAKGFWTRDTSKIIQGDPKSFLDDMNTSQDELFFEALRVIGKMTGEPPCKW